MADNDYWNQPPAHPGQPQAENGVAYPQDLTMGTRQAAVAPAQIAPGTKFKVHSSYIWMNLVGVFIGIVVFGGATALGSLENLIAFVCCVVGCFVLLVLIGVMTYLDYRNMWYEFDEKEFSLYRGVISKHRLHVPYTRVQSVNHTASLLQRIIGVCTVAIDTAGGASNKAVRVPYVTNAAAEQIRYELFTRKQAMLNEQSPEVAAGAPTGQAVNALDAAAGDLGRMRGAFGGAEVDTGAVSYRFGLTGRELMLTALASCWGPAGYFALALFGLLGMVAPILDSVFTGLAQQIDTAVLAQSATSLVTSLAFGVFCLFLISLAGGFVGTCISYGGFTAVRRGTRIEVERGLIQREFSGLDVQRVQSVVVKQSFVRRLMGYCEISLGRIDSADQKDSSNQNAAKLNRRGLVIHPFVKKDRVPEILAGLIPEYADIPLEFTGLPAVATRRSLVRNCIWRSGSFWLLLVTLAYLLIAVPSGFGARQLFAIPSSETGILAFVDAAPIAIVILCVFWLVFEAVNSMLWVRESGFAYNHAFMTIRNGGFTVETVSFPRSKIQYAFSRRNPFQAMAQVASIYTVTASGVSGTTTMLWDVDENDVTRWMDWFKPRGNMVK